MDKGVDFKGKVALVTGAGSGIGAAIAIFLHKLGATISITDMNEEGLKKTLETCLQISNKSPKPLLSTGDISDEKFQECYMENTIKAFGQVDILVNNAGISTPDSFQNSSLANFDRVIGVNLRTPYNLIALAAPHLKKTKGCIIIISSAISKEAGAINKLSYGISKVGLDKLTQMAANELGNDGIRVNSINPGHVFTNIYKDRFPDATADELDAMFAPRTALGRIATTEDIANTVAFLASDNARAVTGINMLVEAGSFVKFR